MIGLPVTPGRYADTLFAHGRNHFGTGFLSVFPGSGNTYAPGKGRDGLVDRPRGK